MAEIPETLPMIDRFAEAANRAHVPVEVFRLWALRYLRGVNPKQWSHWETGKKPIPEKYIIQFLLDPRGQEIVAEIEKERHKGMG